MLLGIALLTCASTFTSASQSPDEKRERKSARSSTAPNKKEPRAGERKVLDVYLNRRAAYVGGKKQSAEQLHQIVRKQGRQGVTLTVEKGVDDAKVKEVVTQLKKAGATRIKRKTYGPADKVKAAMDKVGGRLQGAQGALQVYLSNRGVWIKGTQLPAGTLTKLARRHGKEGVVISSEPDVSRERIKMIVDEIKEGGVKKIRVTKRVRDEKKVEKNKRTEKKRAQSKRIVQ